jgi:hypothetical protein
MGLLADHPILDPSNATYGWFARNKWHEVMYYAVAADIAPDGTRNCTTPPSATPCLQVDYLPSSGKQRGLVVMSGRSLSGMARPNGNLSDWLEGANADGQTPFAIRSPTLIVNRTFNDRIVVLDANP